MAHSTRISWKVIFKRHCTTFQHKMAIHNVLKSQNSTRLKVVGLCLQCHRNSFPLYSTMVLSCRGGKAKCLMESERVDWKTFWWAENRNPPKWIPIWFFTFHNILLLWQTHPLRENQQTNVLYTMPQICLQAKCKHAPNWETHRDNSKHWKSITRKGYLNCFQTRNKFH